MTAVLERTERQAPAGLRTRQIHAVAACYFVASFAALGLPPYLTAILPSLGDTEARWAGLLYIVPTVFGALGAPLWGRLADRYGRKRLLLRAQLGLAVSFLLAGWADSLAAFTAALVLQGVLGGTFAASNGYLAAALDGHRLSWALTLMQGAARLALVAAPIVVGSLSPWVSPHRQYALLAVLPLAAALMLAALPEPPRPAPGTPAAGDAEAGNAENSGAENGDAEEGRAATGSLRALFALEFAFVLATVISYPYLITLVEERLPGLGSFASGVLFALPHVCYPLLARPVHTAVAHRPLLGAVSGFALVAVALAGHWGAGTVVSFVALRLLLGAGMTLGLVSLSALAADACRGRGPGRMFGTLEFISKAGAVVAGSVAAVSNDVWGPAAPILAGSAVAALTALVSTPTLLRWSR
ncbi:MFS transporter [Streptomyces griseocarneus]|uniref:MFS transporter n=1 Tax=Streptomyces griseocarneus TaxID=51201 RepID=UPI0019AD29C3|nr:MFS transporter [Streptomyces griseocarneus]MBZ6474646.1 MFS transporter [Streptomyces griseocarneus]GHG67056.1 MFS transporter [Streptomyces griseocarneus]